MIIAVSGYSGSGKDTIGTIIQYLFCQEVNDTSIEEACAKYQEHEWWLEERSGWEIRKFAGKLKDIAGHLINVDVKKFEDQEFKKTNLGPDWNIDGKPMSVRDLLQKLGTDAMRNGLHPNVWVNALMSDYVRETDINTFRYAKNYTDERIPSEEERRFPMSQLMEYVSEVPKPNWIITDTRFPNEAQAIKERGGMIIRVERPGLKPLNDHPSETALDDWNFDYKLINNSDIYTLKESVRRLLEFEKLL